MTETVMKMGIFAMLLEEALAPVSVVSWKSR
jgi:hypothetical protein